MVLPLSMAGNAAVGQELTQGVQCDPCVAPAMRKDVFGSELWHLGTAKSLSDVTHQGSKQACMHAYVLRCYLPNETA